jgi:translation initiation factor IF-2
MNKLQLLFCLLIINSFAFSQNNNEIIEWQKNNPDVIFIEKNDASNDLIEKLDTKGIKYIIFNNEVQESDILNFTSTNSLKSDYYHLDGFNVRMEEAQFVKEWFASHTDIKVFTKSAILAFSPDQIENYRLIDALILEGEIITMQDLKNYDNEH